MSENQKPKTIENSEVSDSRTDEFNSALNHLKEGFKNIFILLKKETENHVKGMLSKNSDSVNKTSFENSIRNDDFSNGPNLGGISLAALGLLSIFLPWLAISTSMNFNSFDYGGSEMADAAASMNISGIRTNGGIFAILVSIVGFLMVLKLPKYSFVCGAINSIIAFGYFMDWFMPSVSASYSNMGSSVSVSMDAKFGLYLFTISSIGFFIVMMKSFIRLKK